MKKYLFFLVIMAYCSSINAIDKIVLSSNETVTGFITHESKSAVSIKIDGRRSSKFKYIDIKEIYYDSGIIRYFENGLCSKTAKDPTSKVVFINDEQKWEFVSATLDGGYTVLTFNISIIGRCGGCFDAHYYDKRRSEIYIVGDMGRLNLVKSTYKGDYEAWEMYPGYVREEYFESSQKGKTAAATLYFPRVPMGVQSIDLHFNGGTADSRGPGNDICPVFSMQDIFIEGNSNSVIRSKWTERELKEYWSSNQIYPMEGIYSFLRTNNINYWGENRHRIAIVKVEEGYDILYLDGANNSIWSVGELKGKCSATKTKTIYKIDLWYLENKQICDDALYIKYYNNGITIYDEVGHINTDFLKLYPQEDLDEELSENSARTSKSGEDKILHGNGSGFFIGEDIIATNYHVIKDAKSIDIIVSNTSSVETYEAKVLCVDKVNDLALVQIIDKKFKSIKQLPYRIAPRSSDVGISIFSMGYPYAKNGMGDEVKITDGIISSKTGADGDIVHYQISAPIQPGNSGGPLFDKKGTVVGITSSGMKGLDNVGYAIKSVYLNNLIDSSPISIKDITSDIASGKDLPALIKAIRPYVVMILIY